MPVPPPPHQVVVGRLHFALASYLQTRPDLAVLSSPAEITWDEEQPVQPDLFVVPVRELSAGWNTARTGDGDRPEIVTDALRWRVAPAARELVVDLGELFGDLPRE